MGDIELHCKELEGGKGWLGSKRWEELQPHDMGMNRFLPLGQVPPVWSPQWVPVCGREIDQVWLKCVSEEPVKWKVVRKKGDTTWMWTYCHHWVNRMSVLGSLWRSFYIWSSIMSTNSQNLLLDQFQVSSESSVFRCHEPPLVHLTWMNWILYIRLGKEYKFVTEKMQVSNNMYYICNVTYKECEPPPLYCRDIYGVPTWFHK